MNAGVRDRNELRAMFDEFARSGSDELRAALIEAHVGLAEHLARRFTHRGESYDDLVQVGSLGLIKAVDRFDPDRGVEFATYATKTILGELKRHFRDKGWAIRAPRRVQELYLHLGQAIGQLSQELGRSPTLAELAVETGASEDDVIEALEAGQAYRSASLDSAGPDEEALATRLGVEDERFGDAEWRAVLLPHLEKLAPRDREILKLRFVDGQTQSEIAARIDISQMHVSRLLTRSLNNLRQRCAPAVEGTAHSGELSDTA
ncbi:MAG TPA: SigB/SigF/SigG family RNA polymerase sigma factor [Acidimicrobiales bacterium]|nr:SigB/SigF/SigG family RNA polymerase sigma factor [Acidimicrobiales bacterium]